MKLRNVFPMLKELFLIVFVDWILTGIVEIYDYLKNLNKMKKLILVIFMAFIGEVDAQIIYRTYYMAEADYIVYTTDYQAEADQTIYRTSYRNEAGSGTWYFTKARNEADLIVYFTSYSYEATLLIYYSDYQEEAESDDY